MPQGGRPAPAANEGELMHATTDRLPSSKATIFYPPSILEEELKNRVAVDWFSAFDCSHILGKVDFCATVPATDLSLCDAESVLWAEAKRGADAPLDFALVQLILTIGKERTFDRHLPPKYLAAFNAARIAFIPYSEVVEIFYQNDFNWNVAPSDHETREFGDLYQRVIRILESATLEFDFRKDEAELRRFIKTNLYTGGRASTRAAVQITKNNFTHIYQRWRETVMPTILVPDWAIAKKNGIIDADFFLADIFSSDNAAVTDRLNVLLMNDHYRQSGGTNALGFQLFSEISFSDGQKAHHLFWNRYKRPPRKEYWNYIVNRRDLLVPQDVRERKGSFFTPQQWVSLSQDYLAAVLGENWQDDHYVWDCCGGTGNLEVGLTNKYNVWVSTLDQQDVDVIHERIKLGATLLDSHVFQFDFLNDSFDKLPQGLKEIVNDPERRKRLVIYINPPYAEAGTIRAKTGTGENKTGVAVRHAVSEKYKSLIGAASNELFALFLTRISYEIPGCVVGQFSKLKHLTAPNFAMFRTVFHGKIEKCFLVPADTFDNVKGKFPIGFFVWNLCGRDAMPLHDNEGTSVMQRPSIIADVYERNGEFSGNHIILCPDKGRLWMDWVKTMHDKRGSLIGHLRTTCSDFQNQNGTFIALNQDITKKHLKFGGERIFYSVNDVEILEKKPSYTKFEYNGFEYELNVEGDYNIENSLSAINVGLKVGMSPEDIAQGLKTYRPIEKRWEVENIKGFRFINDSYNANPESMMASVKAFVELYPNPVVVLGNMAELGDEEKKLHADVGIYLSKFDKNVKYLLIGNLAAEIGKVLENSGFSVKYFDDNKQAAVYIVENLDKSNTIFLKASRAMQLEEILEIIKK